MTLGTWLKLAVGLGTTAVFAAGGQWVMVKAHGQRLDEAEKEIKELREAKAASVVGVEMNRQLIYQNQAMLKEIRSDIKQIIREDRNGR